MKLKLVGASAAHANACAQALGYVLGEARGGRVDSVLIMWWPVGSRGAVQDARWLLAGRASVHPNDVHAGAGRLMRSLIEPPGE